MGTEAGTGSSGTTEDGFRLAPSQYDFFYQSTHKNKHNSSSVVQISFSEQKTVLTT